MNNQLATALKTLLKEKGWIELAFLFGSRSKGRGAVESDFDIAVWPDENAEENNLAALWLELESTIKKPVDLVNLTAASPLVAWEAFKGIPLLIKDRRFYINKLIEVSSEAEDMNNFITDVWRAREAKEK